MSSHRPHSIERHFPSAKGTLPPACTCSGFQGIPPCPAPSNILEIQPLGGIMVPQRQRQSRRGHGLEVQEQIQPRITLGCLVLAMVPGELWSLTVALGRHFTGKKEMRPLVPGENRKGKGGGTGQGPPELCPEPPAPGTRTVRSIVVTA